MSDTASPEAAEIRYGPGSAEWVAAAKSEIERLRVDKAMLRAAVQGVLDARSEDDLRAAWNAARHTLRGIPAT